MAVSHARSVEIVAGLIRPPLEYDSELWPALDQVIGTHGTRIDSIQRLAVQGFFSGGHPDLQDEFFLTPNVHTKSWDKSPHAEQIATLKRIGAPDPIERAVEYSEMADCLDADGQYVPNIPGVVITIGAKALSQVIHIDVMDSEVVLQGPPAIEAIEGIYPVDAEAAEQLAMFLRS